MNYQHAYHAGNHADVLKHVCLQAILDQLTRKPKPFFVLDTHAGEGRYRLDSAAAEKTREAATGIEPLLRWENGILAPALQRYLAVVKPHLEGGWYPGSPVLIANALDENSLLACCELQVEAAGQLRRQFSGDARVGVHQRDGYVAMKALLPPPIRRGLVLIDPPYEAQSAEFDIVLDALRTGLQRWPQGIFALWYPIKQRRSLHMFLRGATRLPAKSSFVAELLIRPDNSPLRMNGSGMLLINPPWQLDQALAAALPQLVMALGEAGASWRLDWLKQEADN